MEIPFLKTAVIVVTSGLLGHIVVAPIMWLLWRSFLTLPGARETIGEENSFDEQFKMKRTITAVLGIVERMVYAGSWLLGGREIIIAVLAIKAQPGLKEWSEKKILGRTQFNVWFIGNLLNIMVAIGIAEGLHQLWR